MNNLERTALVAGGVGLAAWLLLRPRRPEYDFAGKTVLITGGSRGLGLVLARDLARQGARLALCARDGQELRAAAEDLAGSGAQVRTYSCDVTDAADVRGMVAAAAAELGPIDVLINNAGVISVGPLAEMTREDFERLLAVSFWGAYNTVEAVLPGMRQRGAGRVVNISSVGGKVSVPHLLPYSVGKFALTGYSQGLRSALAAEGIVVTTVCPGLMRTGSPPNAQFKGHNEAEYAWFTVGDSLPLLSTSAESAAAAILAACRRGDAEITLTLPAKVAVVMHALFPEQTAELLSLVDRLLPGPGGVGSAAVAGWDSGAATPAWLTVLTQWAARRNNEISPLQG